MATVSSLRAGLANTLGTYCDLNMVYQEWPASPLFPCAIIELVGVQHEQTLGSSSGTDLARYDFEIVVAVSESPPLEVAQQTLDNFVSNTGAKSIRAALAADRTLGGVAHCVFPQPWERPDDEQFGGLQALAMRMPLQVWAG